MIESPAQLRDRAEGMSVGGPFEVVMGLAVLAAQIERVAAVLEAIAHGGSGTREFEVVMAVAVPQVDRVADVLEKIAGETGIVYTRDADRE